MRAAARVKLQHISNGRGKAPVYGGMENTADEILRAFPAGENASDMLAEAARLDELGLGYPLNMMCSLYYESTCEPPQLPQGIPGSLAPLTKPTPQNKDSL